MGLVVSPKRRHDASASENGEHRATPSGMMRGGISDRCRRSLVGSSDGIAVLVVGEQCSSVDGGLE